MNKIKKPLALLLALMMLMTAMPLAAIPAFAAENVTYVDRTWDTTNKKVVEETKTATATPIESSTTAITLDGGWYVVSGNVEITAAITVSGTPDDNLTCIILKDGCKLTASKGIVVNSGKALAIYAQTAGTGELDAIGDSNVAGIGGAAMKACGTITINGGTINATGGSTAGAGIGGSRRGAGGNITINGGTVTATGGTDSAGIGGGNTGVVGGTVTVNGGTITATGGRGAAGIGGGRSCKSFTVTINGGTVTATGGYDVDHDESGGAGIGGGTSGNGTGDSKISINGGTVNATGADGGAGIGSGAYAQDPGRTIIITGGNITAAGANGGSGIGSGRFSEDTDSTITITDGTVTATGADGGAGIGGGKFEEGDAVTITGGTVTATGASGGAGIGGGDSCVSHGVLEADYEVMRAGDAAPGEDTTLDDYLTARSTYAYIHTHKFDSYTDNGDGTHSRTCACEAKENVKIDHTFVDGVCTFCGAEEPVTHTHDYTDSYVNNNDGTHSGKCECGEVSNEKVAHTYDATGSCVCGAKVTPLYKNYLIEGKEPIASGANGYYNRYSYYLGENGTQNVLNYAVYNPDKEVSFEAWYLRTMVQYKSAGDGKLDIRFVTMLDENLDKYEEAGFNYTVDGESGKLTTKVGYTSFIADGKTTYISEYSQEDDYFVLQNTVFAKEVVVLDPVITVTPYVKLMDGTVLEGKTVTFHISDFYE